MTDIKWTAEQERVIKARNGSLLVSAAAGSGKTAVLVERIITMVTDPLKPVDIDTLLVVTFTNAAAAEMRDRIQKALTDKLDTNPSDRNLRRQIILLGNASIMTIHSFCLKVIRNNIGLLDIDPSARIGDEGEVSIIKQEVIERLIEESYSRKDGRFRDLSDWINTPKSGSALISLALKIYSFAMSSPYPSIWLLESLGEYEKTYSDFSDSLWGKHILKTIRNETEHIKTNIESIIESFTGLEGYEKITGTFKDDYQMICEIEGSTDSWDSLCDLVRRIEFGRIGNIGKAYDKEASLGPKAYRDEYKKTLGVYKETIYMKTDDINRVFSNWSPVIKELIDLVCSFSENYRTVKREQRLIDFNDIEHLCLELLTEKSENGSGVSALPSSIAREISGKYSEILVDEYQDSNMVQETIIKMISGSAKGIYNIFMVGDVKQSIYRFRMARPDLFLEKYERFSSGSDSDEMKIDLYRNFRSGNEIIEFINSVFEKIMSESCGEIDYTEDQKLLPGLDKKVSLRPYFALLDKSEIQQDSEYMNNAELEARYMAKKIREIVNNKDDTYNKYEFKDIVILLRSTKGWSEFFMEELERNGIPVFTDSGSGYFETVEIGVFMSLLRIIDNPRQDIPLLSVLRSSLGGFTDDELVDIRLISREKMFYENLVSMAKRSKDDSWQKEKNAVCIEKARNFLLKISIWRKQSLKMELGVLIWHLLKDSGYYYDVQKMEGAEQRKANLRLLAYRAAGFEKTSLKGLFSFITYIEKLKTRSQDYGSAKVLGEDENLVRIMSIHKSKGLEFPVVFVGGLGRRFNKQDMREKVLLHQKLGIGTDYLINPDLVDETPAKTAIKMIVKNEGISEEMRILYVALTRARDLLYMIASVNDTEKIMEKYDMLKINDGRLPPAYVAAADSYTDWLIPSILNDSELCDFEIVKSLYDTEKVEPLFEPIKEETGITASVSRFVGKTDAEQILFNKQKISVTELKRIFEYQDIDEAGSAFAESREYKKPKFISEKKGLTGAEKGKALHYVMQHIDFGKAVSIDSINNQIKAMVKDEKITEKQAESININTILDFMKSELGRRIKASSSICRETPFIMEIGRDVFQFRSLASDKESHKDADKIILQGIIDLYFEEDEGYILVDYKTDFITHENLQQKTEQYRLQLDYYEKALKQLTGKEITEKYIYFFSSNEAVKL